MSRKTASIGGKLASIHTNITNLIRSSNHQQQFACKISVSIMNNFISLTQPSTHKQMHTYMHKHKLPATFTHCHKLFNKIPLKSSAPPNSLQLRTACTVVTEPTTRATVDMHRQIIRQTMTRSCCTERCCA